MNKSDKLKAGDIVQLNPVLCKNPMLASCFMTITEIYSFGVQGYIQVTGINNKPGGQAYYRATWEEMEFCGYAMWTTE